MEILFISHKYPPTIGGMEKQSYELIKEISKVHKVHKIAYNSVEEYKTSFFLKLKKRVKDVLAKHPNIKMIHLNDGAMGALCYWLRKEVKIPVTVTLHGLDVVFPNYYYQKYIIKQLKKFDGFICVSESTAQECIERGFDTKKTFVVANGVDPELAKIPTYLNGLASKIENELKIDDLKGKKILISLGRMTKRKGFVWFLKNVVPLLDDDTIFILVGPEIGKKQSSWRKIVPKKLLHEFELSIGAVDESHLLNDIMRRKDIRSKVFVAGKQPFKEVMSLLSTAHLFVMPNIKVEGDAEGFGLVALEAAVRGTTVLASNIEGITQAIQHNKNGILLPSADPQAWIECIREQFKDMDALEQQSKKFQQFTLDNYTWEKMANSYVDVFEKVIDTNDSPI